MNMLTLNSKQIGKVVFKATVDYYIGKNIALFANSIINKLVIEPSFTTLANNGNKTATENPNDIKMGFHM